MAKQYRKKPVVIEAIQWTGDNLHEIAEWAQPFVSGNAKDPGRIHIQTKEGLMWADVGAWVIKGVQGEFYACKEDIFAATYEGV